MLIKFQPKYEYVLCLCLTEMQKKLYTFYLDNYARAGQIGEEGKMEGKETLFLVFGEVYIKVRYDPVKLWKIFYPIIFI